MATPSNCVRDDHFVRTLIDLVQRGERLLAIAGRSHAIAQEPGLWESQQPASFGQRTSRANPGRTAARSVAATTN